MVIYEMTEEECREALMRESFGRLACARKNQPYIVPIYFAYHQGYLYGFSMLGQKVEWMRSNPRVCVEIETITSRDRWLSVVVAGYYEELPDRPESEEVLLDAYELLRKRALWWQPAYVSAVHRGESQSAPPIFYRVRIDKVTGHRAFPDPAEAAAAGVTVAGRIETAKQSSTRGSRSRQPLNRLG